MTRTLGQLRDTIGGRMGLWLAITIGFGIAYYLALMASLILRFGNWPNYIVTYDWFGNVAVIIRSTPAISDMPPIILDEWLLEIGHMNRSFGNGISEWSLYVVPHKLLLVFLLGALIATNALLLLERRACRLASPLSASAATGVGATLVAMSTTTMSWVVCCSTPSWVVGLAMLGLGVSTSLWLEPLGGWLMGAGFATLTITAIVLARGLASTRGHHSAEGPASASRYIPVEDAR